MNGNFVFQDIFGGLKFGKWKSDKKDGTYPDQNLKDHFAKLEANQIVLPEICKDRSLLQMHLFNKVTSEIELIKAKLERFETCEPLPALKGVTIQKKDVVSFGKVSTYEGEWNTKTNLKHGRGTFVNNDGCVHKGYFENDKANGIGLRHYINGDLFKGEFKDDLFSGLGVLLLSNGDQYVG